MNTLLNNVSKTLRIPPDQIISLGIKSFLEREIRLAELDIADLRDKYLAVSKSDLESKIKAKEISSHPAWEDLITWENSESYIAQLKMIIEKQSKHDSHI